MNHTVKTYIDFLIADVLTKNAVKSMTIKSTQLKIIYIDINFEVEKYFAFYMKCRQ